MNRRQLTSRAALAFIPPSVWAAPLDVTLRYDAACTDEPFPQGSLWYGPTSFRLMYMLLVPPTYSLILVCLGTMVGRRRFFSKVALRMWGRFLPASLRKKLLA